MVGDTGHGACARGPVREVASACVRVFADPLLARESYALALFVLGVYYYN